MRDLFGATLIGENTSEDEGKFKEGFWDQLYKLRQLDKDGQPKKLYTESELKDGKWWGRGYAFKWEKGKKVPTGKGVPFKYDTVDIPHRKAKNKASFFFLHSMDPEDGLGCYITRAAMDRAIERNGGKPKFKLAKGEDDGGHYFSVPVEDVSFFERGPDGRWRRWKRP